MLPGIVAFYVYDAALLLYADEVVFTKPARRWTAALGNGSLLGGRYLAFPGMLSPGSPVFRTSWRADPQSAACPASDEVLGVVRPLRWHAWWLAFALFALVPLALTWHAPPAWWLGLLALVYLPTMLATWHVARLRRRLSLSRKDVAAIAFDVIACPPFALNLARRVTLRCGLAQSAPAFADRVLDPASRLRLEASWETRRRLLLDGSEAERHSDSDQAGGAA